MSVKTFGKKNYACKCKFCGESFIVTGGVLFERAIRSVQPLMVESRECVRCTKVYNDQRAALLAKVGV